MTKKARFEFTALVASALGVLVIVGSVLVSRGETEPRRLQVDPEARRIEESGIAAGGASNVADTSVRGASHQVVMPLVATAAALGADPPATGVRIEHVTSDDDKYRWPGTEQQLIRVTSETVKIQLSGGESHAKYTIVGGKSPVGPKEGNAELTVQLQPGENSLKIVKGKDEETGVTIRLRPPDKRMAMPTVSKFSNNKYANTTDLPSVEPPSDEGVRIYSGYLRVQGGLAAGDFRNLRFALFARNSDGTHTFSADLPADPTRIPSRTWDIELSLPDTIPYRFKGSLLAYTEFDGNHAFSATPIHFTLVDDRPPVGRPSISSVLPDSSDPPTSTIRRPEPPLPWIVRGSRSFRLQGDASNIPQEARQDSRIVVYEVSEGRSVRVFDGMGIQIQQVANGSIWTTPDITVDNDGDYEYEARVVQGDALSEPSQRVTLLVRTKGPSIRDIEPRNLLFGPGRITLTVYFDRERPLTRNSAEMKNSYAITGPGIHAPAPAGTPSSEAAAQQSTSRGEPPIQATFDPRENAVTLSFKDYPDDGEYTILIKKKTNDQSDGVVDIYGNALESDDAAGESFTIIRSKLSGPSVRPGISGRTGPYVPYPEFTQPRTVPDGFNPHDKVETRVVRLYYYRDAHRVAQIVNRDVKSYNRQGVDMARQLADKARSDANRRTESRKEAERAAILKAQETRRIESQLRVAEEGLNRSVQELTNARRQGAQATDAVVQQLEATTRSFANQLDSLRRDVERARTNEAQANELTQQLEEQERRAREEQFRREVAAAHADPDTYAPGVPTSDDPVQQVSVSVIGEGLIHLRGPMKGVNTIRTMIDQIDQPVGQVRVSVHTVQINGERQERMEDVANIIQRYIDHARFLTMQSSEMLRKAIVQVASRKAEEAMALYPGESQEDRDRRYLYAFFGQDFIRELEVMDSEFLHTGNKLLALHSMDTISLSSALNLLALANNTTRLEIFHEFDRMVQGELPCAEASYLEAGLTAIRRSRLSLRHPPTFYPMAQNARFESLRGFFNMQIGHPDTMTPLQREFVRLAQIFKSRLITELEYKQRVMERAVIEERAGGNYLQELATARNKERRAQSELETARQEQVDQQRIVLEGLSRLRGSVQVSAKLAMENVKELEKVQNDLSLFLKQAEREAQEQAQAVRALESERGFDLLRMGPYQISGQWSDKGMLKIEKAIRGKDLNRTREAEDFLVTQYRNVLRVIRRTFQDQIDIYHYTGPRYASYSRLRSILWNEKEGRWSDQIKHLRDDEKTREDANNSKKLQSAAEALRLTIELARHVSFIAASLDHETNQLVEAMMDPAADIQDVFQSWIVLKESINRSIWRPYSDRRDQQDCEPNDQQDGELKDQQEEVVEATKTVNGPPLTGVSRRFIEDGKVWVKEVDDAFDSLIESGLKFRFSRLEAELARRPLDHIKFLDMLIDDLEEKYIELLDGTRAHTANVDNYLKRLTTALDDDFNTQFYHPAFRYIREASTHWDVQFGQTETTSILANNREFAKVDPSATMEFDLPPRDILFAEALNGAKALMDDVGALANDPTFLAMAKVRTQGSGISPPPGSTGGFGVVRDVLPGLNSSTAEQIMAHNAGARPQLGSNLENLIPDPAIYKFETGTGFEIRPVIQPDGQAVVFNFNYMYTTNIREPVRADEKHLGRVRRHFIHTDVQLSNFELREVSRYTVALKAARTSRGVPLLEDIPVIGALWRPLPSSESSLQQNIILSQATIFPTLFDLMGLRWAPVVSDMDPLRVSNREFIVRGRQRALENRVYDYASSQVDEFLRIPEANRRTDLYRSQETIPWMHPNGYQGPGLDLRDSQLQEGYQPERVHPPSGFIPGESREGALFRPGRNFGSPSGTRIESYPLDEAAPERPDPVPIVEPANRIRLP